MKSIEANPVAALFAEHGEEYRVAGALGLLLLLNVTGLFTAVLGLNTALIVTAIAGYKTFHNSITALIERRISADIALCIAVVAAVYAGEYLAAAEAMFIVMVGETLESYAAGRTEAAIERFVAQLPRMARVVRFGGEESVDAESLVPGDRIVIRAGERVPADGVVESGYSSIDESSITGELLPRNKEPGAEVFSGTLNGNGFLRVHVTRAGSETTLARVVQLVREAKLKRAPVERLADRYARFFLPALLLAGALTFYFTGSWTRTVAVLVVACPCALILATPTAMVAAIGGLARRGILVRGGGVLQHAAKVDTIAFDKTGTVTEGRFEIVELMAVDRGEDELLRLGAAVEIGSDHALARAIVTEARLRGLSIPACTGSHALPGKGVECYIDGRLIRAGSPAFMADSGVSGIVPIENQADRIGATAILVAEDNRLAGGILLRDRVRDGMRESVAALRAMGIVHQLMLTGDRPSAAEAIAREAGIDQVEAGLLPEQKLDRIRTLAAGERTIAMVGDGINDAPALAAAAVGIAVSGASDIAAEAAGVVYLPHSLESLPEFFQVSRRAMRTAWINIVVFAGLVNLLAIIACATGRLGPVGAAVTHQLASFCVMLNSLRLLRVEQAEPWRWHVSMSRIRSGWWREFSRFLEPALAVAAAAVVISGVYTIRPDEVGVIERFGKKMLPFSAPGLHYKLPWPVDRLTRIAARRIRVVEIGFRSKSAAIAPEPASYEWNLAHRGGRYESRPDEARTLTGDQNMIELNASVHYEIEHPDRFLFRQLDGDATIRAAAESVIHGIAATLPLDAVLTTGREAAENRARNELQQRANRYETGIHILQVKLEDVHPSMEVVDAFREVSAALEEKNRLINEAEGYRNEQISLGRGNAKALIQNARQYALGRINRAAGDASRFNRQEQSFRTAPGPTETRLYLEAAEQALAAKKKLILDRSGGRRHLLLVEDGVEIPPAIAAGRDR